MSFAGRNAYNAIQAEHGDPQLTWWSLRDLDRLRRLGDGELAVGVPPVLPLHPGDDLARPEGLERVEGDRGRWGSSRRRSRRSAATRRANARAGRRFDDWRTRIYENSLLLAMTAIFFATWLAQSLNNWREFNAEARRARRTRRRLDRVPLQRRLLGADARRTGNPSSSPSGRWWCSRSTCASAAHRSRSRSARRTRRPDRPDRTCPRDSP